MKKLHLALICSLLFATAKAQHFYLGNDLSYVNQMEDCGAVYKENMVAKDVYQIFADHGTNLVRIRLWNNPTWQNALVQPEGVKAQYNDFDDVKESIKRAKDAGMQVMLDLQLSDFWADPKGQLIPKDWLGVAYNVQALADTVYNYVTRILTTLNNDSLMPEIVKVGNENNAGILMQTTLTANYTVSGTVSTNWTRHAKMYNAAIKAIRDVSKNTSIKPKISLHYAGLKWMADWYQQIINYGVTDFDIIGFSYYYAWHGYSIKGLGDNIRSLKTKFPKYDVMVVETGYLWSDKNFDGLANIVTTPDPQYLPISPQKQLEYMVDYAHEVKKAGGIGVVFWEPAWVSTPCRTPWGKGSSHDHLVFFDPAHTNFMENGGGRWTEPQFYNTPNLHKATFKVAFPESSVTTQAYIHAAFVPNPAHATQMLALGNGIYSYVTWLAQGDTGSYHYSTDSTNRENITGPCMLGSDTDRKFTIGQNDTVLPNIYGSCLGIEGNLKVKVQFNVDVKGRDVSKGVYITGDHTAWKIIKMTDAGNNIYSTSFQLLPGETGAYYFLLTPDWANYKDFRETVPAACALSWGTDRKYVVPHNDTLVKLIFASCDTIGTVSVKKNETNESKLGIFPNPSGGKFRISGIPNNTSSSIEVFNTSGVKIKEMKVHENQLDLSYLSGNMYVLKIAYDNKVGHVQLVIEK